MTVIGSTHHFAFLGLPEISTFPNNTRPVKLQSTKLGLDSKWVLPKSSSKAVYASSSSISGSGAEFSEQLLGAKPKQRRQRIAGIDQDELVDPALLADPDSCFCDFKGVQIHHKVCSPESHDQELSENQISSQSAKQTMKIGLPVILLHGFGASVFSWHRVMKLLAQVVGSKILAFDRPAFGLTSRVNPSEHSSPLNPYSTVFSVLATLYFIDFLRAEKAVLIGAIEGNYDLGSLPQLIISIFRHSAGSLTAVETYFESPERVAALILVAPAIVAPRTSKNVAGKIQSGKENKTQEDRSNPNIPLNPFIRVFNILSKFSKFIAMTIMRLVKGMVDMLNSLYKKALSTILRSAVAVMLVRMVIDKFGIAAIRNSWYNSNQITDHDLHGYTKPLRAKGWDRALVEYTAAMLTDPVSESKPPLGKRLNEISCPVLIITGDNDRLVPSWNSERLSRAIPGARLEVIKNSGHLPHEEKAEEFVTIVEKFLQGVLGNIEEQHVQAAT